MLVFILLDLIFTLSLAYEGLRADSKIMGFVGVFSSGMCAMCVIIGLGYMMGVV